MKKYSPWDESVIRDFVKKLIDDYLPAESTALTDDQKTIIRLVKSNITTGRDWFIGNYIGGLNQEVNT